MALFVYEPSIIGLNTGGTVLEQAGVGYDCERKDIVMSKGLVWFLGWSAALAIALFFPVSKMIWAFSVRRLAHKLGRQLDEKEVAGQKQRAQFIAAFLVAAFALLFNYNVMGIPKF